MPNLFSEQELTQLLQDSAQVPPEEKKENRVRSAVDRLLAGEGALPQAAGMAAGGAKFIANTDLIPKNIKYVE